MNSHDFDLLTHYCLKCGQGYSVAASICPGTKNVIAISHLIARARLDTMHKTLLGETTTALTPEFLTLFYINCVEAISRTNRSDFLMPQPLNLITYFHFVPCSRPKGNSILDRVWQAVHFNVGKRDS